MKSKIKPTPITESAAAVQAAHDKVEKSRRNLKSKRALFMAAQLTNQEAEADFRKVKDLHDQKLVETV